MRDLGRLIVAGVACSLMVAGLTTQAQAQFGPPEPGSGDAAGWLAERDRLLGLPPGADLVPEAEGTAAQADPTAGAAAPIVVESDVRLALAQLASATGSAGQVDIAAVQAAGGPGAIYLRAGRASMASLYEATRGTDLEPVLTRTDTGYVATRPIVVIQGAALSIGPGEDLTLDSAGGTFLLSFGDLSIDGATLRATTPVVEETPPGALPKPGDGYRPFVASIGTGTLRATDSVFLGLGSGIAPFASGLAVSTGGLFANAGAARIEDNLFIDVFGLSVIDNDDAVIRDNRFDWPRGVAVYVAGGGGVTVASNVVVEPDGDYAMRIDGPMVGIDVTDNVMTSGSHAGLRIAGDATGALLGGNVVEGFAGSAVVVENGVRCLLLTRNLIQGNGGDGVKASEMGDVVLDGNAIIRNAGAGISLARARAGAALMVAGNLMVGNRSGVRTATIEALRIAGNDMTGQLPRPLAGDLDQLTPLWLRESKGGASPSLEVNDIVAVTAGALEPDAPRAAFDACRAGGAT